MVRSTDLYYSSTYQSPRVTNSPIMVYTSWDISALASMDSYMKMLLNKDYERRDISLRNEEGRVRKGG